MPRDLLLAECWRACRVGGLRVVGAPEPVISGKIGLSSRVTSGRSFAVLQLGSRIVMLRTWRVATGLRALFPISRGVDGQRDSDIEITPRPLGMTGSTVAHPKRSSHRTRRASWLTVGPRTVFFPGFPLLEALNRVATECALKIFALALVTGTPNGIPSLSARHSDGRLLGSGPQDRDCDDSQRGS